MTSPDDFLRCPHDLADYLTKSHTSALTGTPGAPSVGDANDNRRRLEESVSRKILVIVSEHGYWAEELIGPVSQFDEQGYEVVFATPTGKRAHALPPSLDAKYIDPPLGRSVTTEENARLGREFEQSSRLDSPSTSKRGPPSARTRATRPICPSWSSTTAIWTSSRPTSPVSTRCSSWAAAVRSRTSPTTSACTP